VGKEVEGIISNDTDLRKEMEKLESLGCVSCEQENTSQQGNYPVVCRVLLVLLRLVGLWWLTAFFLMLALPEPEENIFDLLRFWFVCFIFDLACGALGVMVTIIEILGCY
ncbi:MAG: hypothetical protein J7L32_00660, partial [Thermoplasmata archaeon]|nr:hypothetical protein [Thermoplasmata archaeon]